MAEDPIIGYLIQSPTEAPPPPRGDFAKGFGVGVAGLKATGGGLLALTGRAFGAEGLERAGLDYAAEQNALAAQDARRVEDVGSVGEGIDFAQYAFGQALPSILLSIIGGGAGGAAAAVGTKLLAKQATEALVKKAGLIGATTGAGAAAIGMETGSIFPEAVEEKIDNPIARSLAGGVAAGALDILPQFYVAKRLGLLGKTARGEREPGIGALARTVGAEAGITAGLEAGTEGLQSVIERVAAGQAVTSPEALSDILNSAVIGGIAGGVLGGGAGLVTPVAKQNVPAPASEPAPAPAPAPVTEAPKPLEQISLEAGRAQIETLTGLEQAATARLTALDDELSQPDGQRRPKSDILRDLRTARAERETIREQRTLVEARMAAPLDTTPVGVAQARRETGQLLDADEAAQLTQKTRKQDAPESSIIQTREPDPDTVAAETAVAQVKRDLGLLVSSREAKLVPKVDRGDVQLVTELRKEPKLRIPVEKDVTPERRAKLVGDLAREAISQEIPKLVEAAGTKSRKTLIKRTEAELAAAAAKAAQAPSLTAAGQQMRDAARTILKNKVNEADVDTFVDTVLGAMYEAPTFYSKGARIEDRAEIDTKAARTTDTNEVMSFQTREMAQARIPKDKQSQWEPRAWKPGPKQPLRWYVMPKEKGPGTKGAQADIDLTVSPQEFLRVSTSLEPGAVAPPDLVESIRKEGIKEPLMLRFKEKFSPSGKRKGLEILEHDGRHRALAAIQLGIQQVPVKIEGSKALMGDVSQVDILRMLKQDGGVFAQTGTQWPLTFNRAPQESRAAQTAAVDFRNTILEARGREAIAEFKRIFGDDPNLEVRQFEAAPGEPVGRYTRTGLIKALIEVAFNAKDVLSTYYHEGFHYLEAQKLTYAERQVVANALKPGKPLFAQVLARARTYDLANKTSLADEVLSRPEEARAYGFEFWRKGELQADGPLARVFQKLQQVLERVVNFVKGQGFQSIEDIFEAIDKGAFAERQAVPLLAFNRAAQGQLSPEEGLLSRAAQARFKVALRLPTGEVVPAIGDERVHSQIFNRLTETRDIFLDYTFAEQTDFGFLDDKGKYLTRAEATSALGREAEGETLGENTFFSRAALLSDAEFKAQVRDILRRTEAGELEREQGMYELGRLMDQAEHPTPSPKQFFGIFGEHFKGGISHFLSRHLYTGLHKARHSLGYKNGNDVMQTYVQFKHTLISQASREQLRDWHTAAASDIEAATSALWEQNQRNYALGSNEYNTLRDRLNPEQLRLFEQARTMIATGLKREFDAEKITYSRALAGQELLAWIKAQPTDPTDEAILAQSAALDEAGTQAWIDQFVEKHGRIPPEAEVDAREGRTSYFAEWYVKRRTQIEGLIPYYIPQRRHGDHTVYVYQPVTDPTTGVTEKFTITYDQFDQKGAALVWQTQVQEMLKGVNPNLRVEYGYRYKMERDASVSFQQFLDLARRHDINLTQQERERIAKALLNADSMRFSRIFHRKGVPGFSKDMMRVLHEFIVLTSNKIAQTEFSEAINEALFGRPVETRVENGTPIIKVDHTRNLWDEEGPESGFSRGLLDETADFVLTADHGSKWATRLRTAALMYFIGASPAFGVINSMSVPMNTLPWLSMSTSYTNAFTTTFGAWKTAWANMRMLRDVNTLKDRRIAIPEIDNMPGLRDALVIAAEDGTTQDTEIHQIVGLSQGQLLAQSRGAQKAMELWLAPFRISEQMNRISSFIAGFRVGQENGLTGRALYEFAKKTVDSTQNRYDEVNRPGIARHPIGAMLFMFKSFPMFVIEMLQHMAKENPKAAVHMLLGLVIVSGINGLPFAEAIQDLIDLISNRLFGSPFNTRKAMRNYLKAASEAVVGADLSNLFIRGVVNDLLDINVASRVGLGDFVPGTRLGAADTDYARVAEQLLGAPIGMLTQVGAATKPLLKGNFLEALRAGGPVAVRNLIKGGEQATTGEARDAGGRKLMDVTGLQAFWQSVGFSSGSLTKLYDTDRLDKQTSAFYAMVRDDFADALTKAVRAGDTAKAQDVMASILAWNESYPDMPIGYAPAVMRRRIMEAGMPLNERTLRNLPKALRGTSIAAEGVLGP